MERIGVTPIARAPVLLPFRRFSHDLNQMHVTFAVAPGAPPRPASLALRTGRRHTNPIACQGDDP